MKKTLIFCLLLLLALTIPVFAMAASPVPETMPEDLGGKTLYGYLMDLKTQYMPAKVFQDAQKYTDDDRENARRAIRLLVDATTQAMQQAGKEDQYNLYLLAYAYDLLFQDTGDTATREMGLASYQKTVDAGGAYAQADYDRLAALQLKAAPLAWVMPQMLTLDEIGAILGLPTAELMFTTSDYQTDDGGRLGIGYTLRSLADPAAATIFVLADVQGATDRYQALADFAFLQRSTALPQLGDEAILLGMRNMDNNPLLYTTALVRKDSLVLQVRVPFAAWQSKIDPAALATQIAAKVLQNVYDTSRTLPGTEQMAVVQLPATITLDSGTPDSPVPDSLPTDLGGQTAYGFFVSIRNQYLPTDVFTKDTYKQTDRNNARRAIHLLVDNLATQFDLYGQNPYELEIRGACYAAAFADTGEPTYRKLAINDYKQAMSTGYLLAKPDYDRLATPLLSPMAEMPVGTTGEYVALLQRWLAQAGYDMGALTATLDQATVQAVKAYEAAHGLTDDGMVDIALLLSLYSQVEDGDAQLPGA